MDEINEQNEIEYPLVTVITPTKNIVDNELTDEFNILTTLLNRQSYPNIEHLVIDGASKDGTVQVLSDYKSKGYIQFYSEPDTGRYDALSKGIMRARGKYIMFLNCADFVHDIAAIDQIVELLEANGADYTFGTANLIHPEGYVLPFEPSMYNVFQVVPCPLQAMVFRKSILVNEGFFDTKFKHMADFDLIMRIFLKEYGGILFNKNYVTYKLPDSTTETPEIMNSECRGIYIKNFRNMYPLTNEIVDNMVKYSEFPADFLEKLSKYFPEENKNDFLQACEQMHQIRYRAANGLPMEEEEEEEEEEENVVQGDEDLNATVEQQNGSIGDAHTIQQPHQQVQRSPLHTNPQMPPKPHMPGINNIN